jgi:hypothetical protein
MRRRRRSGVDEENPRTAAGSSAIADALWSAQDRVRLACARGFERVAFPLQKRIFWPLSDRAATMDGATRGLSYGVLVLVAAGAGVAGLIWATPDGPHKDSGATPVAAASAPLAAVAKPAPEQAPEPTLQGATPVFEPSPKEAASAEVDPAKAIVKSSPAETPTDAAASSASARPAATASSAAARPATVDGPPAGPKAIAVASDFASAFVLYETGESDSDVRQALGETATPALAKALLRRPPRLPANVEVPKAKVVNVVPAPSRGDIYPVSVSLLRVGLTSELRLEMEKRKADGWRVTNVLG